MRRLGVTLGVLLALVLVGTVAQARHPAPEARTSAKVGPAQAPPARSLASATGDDRRYALANGCYALRSPSTGFVAKAAGGYRASAGSVGEAEGFRMQATALGSYLFYGRERDFMAKGSRACPCRAVPRRWRPPRVPRRPPTGASR